MSPPVDRRDFLRLTALGTAAAALDGCGAIVPAPLRRPLRGAERRRGTVCGACPAGCGISVRVVSGNAVRVDGVPGHPVNDGGVCPAGVAQIQHLYHPSRLRGPLERSRADAWRPWRPVEWNPAITRLADRMRGAPVVFGVGRLPPSEREIVDRMAHALGATVVSVALPFEQPQADGFVVDLAHADYVLSLGADWLQAWASPVEAQRAFAALRRARPRARLVTVAPRLSVTAARSDAWIPMQPGALGALGRGVARGLADSSATPELGLAPGILEALLQELGGAARPLVVTDRSDPEVQAAGTALNLRLGAFGRLGGLLRRIDPPWLPAPAQRPRTVTRFPRGLPAPVVVLVRANPVYLTASAGWAEGLAQASYVAWIDALPDESAAAADLLLAASSGLEARHFAWGTTQEGQPFTSAGPPAVPALYDTLETAEILLRLAARRDLGLPWADHAAYLAARAEASETQELLEGGGFKTLAPAPPGSAEPPAPVAGAVSPGAVATQPVATEEAYPLILVPYVRLAFAGGLGAELPYLHGVAGAQGRETWETVAELHPETARRWSIRQGQRLVVASAVGSVEAVARLREGIHPACVALGIGLGRGPGSSVAGHGANPLGLLAGAGDGDLAWSTTRVQVRGIP